MDLIAVDLSRCVGHGKCYLVAPDLMQPFDDEGHAEFAGEPIDPAHVKLSRLTDAVIASCPEEALSRQRLETD